MEAVATGSPDILLREENARGWQRTAAAIAGVLLGIIFLVSGGWKVLSPFKTGELLEQAQVHAGWGAIGAATLGAIEVFAAILLFLPAFRRWGGFIGSALIIFFMGWIGWYYNVLVGHECSCFPIIKRSIGPGFFFGDGAMLAMGVVAFAWSPRPRSFRLPATLFTILLLLAGANFATQAALRGHAQIPTPVVVNGKPADLSTGRVFLFFYDPSCMHCDAAAKFMSKMDWQGRIVSIPTVNPQWAAEFLRDTHLKADTSLELAKLKAAFPFVDPPYGVALEDGRVKQTFSQAQFNEPSPKADLQKLGLVK